MAVAGVVGIPSAAVHLVGGVSAGVPRALAAVLAAGCFRRFAARRPPRGRCAVAQRARVAVCVQAAVSPGWCLQRVAAWRPTQGRCTRRLVWHVHRHHRVERAISTRQAGARRQRRRSERAASCALPVPRAALLARAAEGSNQGAPSVLQDGLPPRAPQPNHDQARAAHGRRGCAKRRCEGDGAGLLLVARQPLGCCCICRAHPKIHGATCASHREVQIAGLQVIAEGGREGLG
mmetsp:Transcript_10312/g.27377  ORF Transcript_10312/g.27377 Transcript_10312/m.27377 type:complete len:234 (-) Transcript_10312:271-972(-)